MPYIKADAREPLDPLIDALSDALSDALPADVLAGHLNYIVSRLCAKALARNTSYARINELIGALECAKMELYRRVAAPYEDSKAAENGDVYAP
jgi:hypothetical protein